MKAFFYRKFKYEGKKEWFNRFMGIVIGMSLFLVFLYGFYNYTSSLLYKDTSVKEAKSTLDTIDFTANIILKGSTNLKYTGKVQKVEKTEVQSQGNNQKSDVEKFLPGYKETLQKLVNGLAEADKTSVKKLLVVSSDPYKCMLIAVNGKEESSGELNQEEYTNFSTGINGEARRNVAVKMKDTSTEGNEMVTVKEVTKSLQGKDYNLVMSGFSKTEDGQFYDVALLSKLEVWKFPFVPQLALGLGIMGIFILLGFLVTRFLSGKLRAISTGVLFVLFIAASTVLVMNFSKADYLKNTERLVAYYNKNIDIASDVIQKSFNMPLSDESLTILVSNYNVNGYSEVLNAFVYDPSSKQRIREVLDRVVTNTVTNGFDRKTREPITQILIGPGVSQNFNITSSIAIIIMGFLFGGILGGLALIGLSRNRGYEKFLNSLYNFVTAYLFVLPSILAMLVLVFIPIVFTIMIAFTVLPTTFKELNLSRYFIGFQNFVSILTDFNILNPDCFYNTLLFTILYTVVAVLIQAILGVTLAVVLNDKQVRFKGFYQVVFMLPWIIPTYISGLLWNYFFTKNGVIIQLVQVFGGANFDILADPIWSFFCVSFVSAWYAFPFIMLVTLSALQTIPTSIFEAALIDGANWWQTLFQIVLPMIQPTVLPSLLLSSIWTFNNFNLVYLVVSGDNLHQTPDILVTKVYDFTRPLDRVAQLMSQNITHGYAAAYSALVFVILLIYIYVFAKATNLTEKAY